MRLNVLLACLVLTVSACGKDPAKTQGNILISEVDENGDGRCEGIDLDQESEEHRADIPVTPCEHALLENGAIDFNCDGVPDLDPHEIRDCIHELLEDIDENGIPDELRHGGIAEMCGLPPDRAHRPDCCLPRPLDDDSDEDDHPNNGVDLDCDGTIDTPRPLPPPCLPELPESVNLPLDLPHCVPPGIPGGDEQSS